MNAPDLLLKKNVNEAGYFTSQATMADVLTEMPPAGPACKTSDLEKFYAPVRLRSRPKIPQEPLKPGEQYRFHFNASKCIGCECCVVACNEQNGNPPDVQWRKVGEVEGGTYPNTKRYTLSMGCNHCLDPACLTGCPTDAYHKDPVTGIVRHDAESCIGCQYCMWNCPYGVPQFNAERKIVTKCDMCYGRLGMGSEPACVAACPEEAIAIEKVPVQEWRENHGTADAPGMPASDQTLSTTRITLPKDFPLDVHPADEYWVQPEHPHTSLIFMTVLTQLSVGTFFSLWLMEYFTRLAPTFTAFKPFLGTGALAGLCSGMLALAVSVLHLGRPLHAYKALRMWRRSWLSREVLLFGIFSVLATLYALWWRLPSWATGLLGLLVVAAGVGGVLCSGFIYMVPARPAWNTPKTPIRFILTGLILGPLCLHSVFLGWRWLAAPGSAQGLPLSGIDLAPGLWLSIAFVATGVQLVLLLTSLFGLIAREEPELRGTALLLTHRFRNLFVARLLTTAFGGLVLAGMLLYRAWFLGEPLTGAGSFSVALLALAFCAVGECIGRYLFFVTVVPKKVAGSFFR